MTAEQEKEDIKKEAVALIKKIKGEAAYRENLVDKRVVSKFLVNYFEPNTNYHVKLQILETLSSILSFTNEERVKVPSTISSLLFSFILFSCLFFFSLYSSIPPSIPPSSLLHLFLSLIIFFTRLVCIRFFWKSRL